MVVWSSLCSRRDERVVYSRLGAVQVTVALWRGYRTDEQMAGCVKNHWKESGREGEGTDWRTWIKRQNNGKDSVSTRVRGHVGHKLYAVGNKECMGAAGWRAVGGLLLLQRLTGARRPSAVRQRSRWSPVSRDDITSGRLEVRDDKQHVVFTAVQASRNAVVNRSTYYIG